LILFQYFSFIKPISKTLPANPLQDNKLRYAFRRQRVFGQCFLPPLYHNNIFQKDISLFLKNLG